MSSLPAAGPDLLTVLDVFPTDDDFRSLMRESVTANSRVKVEDGLWHDFAEGIFYQAGDFADRAAYRELAERQACKPCRTHSRCFALFGAHEQCQSRPHRR